MYTVLTNSSGIDKHGLLAQMWFICQYNTFKLKIKYLYLFLNLTKDCKIHMCHCQYFWPCLYTSMVHKTEQMNTLQTAVCAHGKRKGLIFLIFTITLYFVCLLKWDIVFTKWKQKHKQSLEFPVKWFAFSRDGVWFCGYVSFLRIA